MLELSLTALTPDIFHQVLAPSSFQTIQILSGRLYKTLGSWHIRPWRFLGHQLYPGSYEVHWHMLLYRILLNKERTTRIPISGGYL